MPSETLHGALPPERRKRQPSHPGALLSELIENVEGTIAGVAREIHVSRQMLHQIIKGTRTVTPEMAVRFTCYFGGEASLWTNMQAAHDLWHAEKKIAKARPVITPHPMKQASG